MNYELWDIGNGAGIASHREASEMRTLIRTLLAHHGTGQENELTLVVLDDEGELDRSVTGQDLVAWADAGSDEQPGEFPGSTGARNNNGSVKAAKDRGPAAAKRDR